MTSSGDTGQPRFVTGSPDKPDRTPSISDVMTQVGLGGSAGVSAHLVAQGINCSTDGALEVLLALQREGQVIAKDGGRAGMTGHHTRFILPPPPSTTVRVRLSAPDRAA